MGMGNDLSIQQFQVVASRKMQPIESAKKKGPSAHMAKAQIEGAVNAIAIHSEPAGRVAKRAGIGINPLVAELVDTLLDWGTAQYQRGVAVGRGPTPPATPLRPALRRAA